MNGSDEMNGDDGRGDLRDERLRHALAHAPDHTAAPDWRTRKAILEHAHEAVFPTLPAPPTVAARSWWQRLLGLGGTDGSTRMPWNAAFATVLVAGLVTLLWQREPVPGARPDDEARSAPAQRQAEAPAAPAAAPPVAPAPAPESASASASTPGPEPAAGAQATERALPSSQDIPGTPLPPPPVEVAPPPAAAKGARPARVPERPATAPEDPARRQADDAALSASSGGGAKEARKREAPAMQPVPPATAPAPWPSTPPSVGAAASRDAAPESLRREAERSAANQRFASPAGPGPGTARDAGEPSRDARAPAAAAPALRAVESSELPSFAALSQWHRLTITPRGGASRSLSRSEAMELNALLGSAAISAVGPQPLSGAAEWRVTLERANGEVLAVFELGRNQVRWREGQKPATTGAPSAASLSALREALQHAVEPPAPPPALRWQPAQPQQPPPAEGGTAPAEPAR